MSDRKVIEARIAELKGQLDHVEGTSTEVYSRIVGYYRSVRNWNAGKREEYGQRLSFDMPASFPLTKAEPVSARPVPASLGPATAAAVRDGVLVFTRAACPNCPPVKNYVVESGMKAVFVDVDQAEGLELARELGVMATPTVLGLDGEGREAFRAFDVASLSHRLASLRTKLESAGAR